MKTKVSVEEMKRHLKRTLKNKVRITISLVFAFLLTNSISMADYLNIDNGKIYSGSSGNSNNKNKEQEGESVALNIRESGDQNEVARDKVAKGSIAIGKGAVTKENNKRGEYGVAIGLSLIHI